MKHSHPNNLRFCELLRRDEPERRAALRASLEDHKLNEALALISEGLDYDTDDEWGRNVVGSLISLVNTEPQCSVLLVHMIEHGLNPLRERHENKMMLLQGIGYRQATEDKLGQMETEGRGLRDHRNGTLYHTMAATLSIWPVAHENDCPGKQAWIRARNDDGAMPLHLLWEQGTLDFELILRGGEAERREDVIQNANIISAIMTRNLLERGADLLDEDREGVSVIELIQKRQEMETQDHEEVRWLRAYIQQKILDRDTPAPGLAAKPGLRL